jgi:hypothetical protein
MSVKSWKFITDGILISGASFSFDVWSKEQPASLCRWKDPQASSSASPAGCAILSRVRKWQWERHALIWRRCWN